MMIPMMGEPKRELLLCGDIDDANVAQIMTQIHDINVYDEMNEQSVVGYQRQPIELVISSGGGSVYAGNALIAVMEASQTPIVTVAAGIVGSMAFGIYVAGTHRTAHRSCRFLYHQIMFGAHGSLKETEIYMDEMRVLQQMYDENILENTKLPKEKLDDIKERRQDYWFSAKEALEFGVVHEIFPKTVE